MVLSPRTKQLLVVISAQLAAFSVGGCVMYPAILLYQLKRNDTEINVDEDTASWIGCIHGIAGIPSVFMAALMQWRGRKFGFLTASFLTIIGWCIVFFANSASLILLSECFHGIGSISIVTISMTSVSEIVDPLYRNAALRTYNICQALGMSVTGTFTLYIYWRNAALIMCLPMVIAFIIACTWPESPSWLAYVGKFDKCRETFTKVRGDNERCRKELIQLITAQSESVTSGKFAFKDVFKRDFYIPIAHMFLLLFLTYWSGTLVILIYSIDMISKATGSESSAIFGGIAVNVLMLIAIATNGLILIKYFTNRNILLTGILGCTVFLILTCIGNLLQYVGTLAKDSNICLYSVLGYIIFGGIGIIPTAFDMGVELLPVKYRGVGGSLYIIFSSILHTSSLKFAPYLFKYINLWGTFLIYSVNATVCGILIWKYLPETKGRTLQEIEDFYTFGKFDENRDNVNRLMFRDTNKRNLAKEEQKESGLNIVPSQSVHHR